MSVALVLPCYNPPAQWAQNVVARYYEFKNAIGADVQLVIVRDGGGKWNETDISLLQAEIPLLKLVAYETNMGKGYAIRQGILQAEAEIYLYTDIDFPYLNAGMVALYKALAGKEADMVIGVKDETYYRQMPPQRRFISKALRKMIRLVFALPVSDTQCGLKGFNKKVKQVFLSTTINRYLFDLEFIRKGYKANFTIKPVPVALKQGVHAPNVNHKVLLGEMVNFIRVMLKK